MFGLLGGLLGAGGSIASGLIGAEAASETADTNWRINLLNYYQRQRERDQAIAMANKLRAEQKLGTTDIRGTRVHFVPGKGWVTEAGPGVANIIGLQDKEQVAQLTHDLPMRRLVMDRNYSRGLEDEALADTFRRRLKNIPSATPDEAYAADFYNAQARGIQQASNDAGRRVFTQAQRTGGANMGPIAAALAREANTSYGDAALKSKIMARGLGRQEQQQQEQNLSGLYNLFATRASQLPETNFKPTLFDNSELDAGAKGALTTGGLGVQTAGMKGGTLDYIQPNYGFANAVGGGASSLASALRGYGAQRAYEGGGGVSGFGGSSGGGRDEYYQDSEGEYS
jgi:hypothetical protein